MPATILEKIVAAKRLEIAQNQRDHPQDQLLEQLAAAPPLRDFLGPLATTGQLSLIAEVKKASPAAGVIRADFQPVEIASIYAAHGASCLSVLTDAQFFQGSLDFLRQVRQAVDLPVLRKDFIIDRYQLLEARAAGADAVLLIAECLAESQLRELHDETRALGMTPLVELYEPANLERVLAAGATLIGINNRNLHTFQVDLEHTLRMRAEVPATCVLVSESGIQTHADAQRLARAGVDAMLVGESLMRQPDIGAAVRALLGSAQQARP